MMIIMMKMMKTTPTKSTKDNDNNKHISKNTTTILTTATTTTSLSSIIATAIRMQKEGYLAIMLSIHAKKQTVLFFSLFFSTLNTSDSTAKLMKCSRDNRTALSEEADASLTPRITRNVCVR